MATITPRKNADGGVIGYQVKVRRKGRKALSKTFDRRGDAQAWARQIEADMDRGAHFAGRIAAEKLLLKDALDRYKKEVSSRKKSHAHEVRRINMLQRIDLAGVALAFLRGADLAQFRDERLDDGKAANTVRLDLALLSHLFTTARKDWGYEGLHNPVSDIRIPSPGEGRDRRLEDGEEARLLTAAEQYPGMAELITFAVETAMRRSEIATLTWGQIDFGKSVAKLLVTKNGSSRTVPLSPKACRLLADRRPADAAPDTLVFGVDAMWITRTFTAVASAADVREMTFHDLRHEGTSRLFEKGLDMMQVAAITGHKTLAMLKRYTHLRPADLVAQLADAEPGQELQAALLDGAAVAARDALRLLGLTDDQISAVLAAAPGRAGQGGQAAATAVPVVPGQGAGKRGRPRKVVVA